MVETIGDLQSFRRRLAEAIAWCTRYVRTSDPVHSLRSPALKPPGVDDYHQDPITPLELLINKRVELLKLEGRYPQAQAESLAGGRLVLYFPYMSLFDGASEAASGGFFDWYNLPPWDTWLFYVPNIIEAGDKRYDSSYLISWVPHQFVELVNLGVRVNAEGCLAWAKNLDPNVPFIRQLSQAGLLA